MTVITVTTSITLVRPKSKLILSETAKGDGMAMVRITVGSWQYLASDGSAVEVGALRFAKKIELGVVQDVIEALVERMSGGRWELTSVPEVLLSLSLLARPHRHKSIV